MTKGKNLAKYYLNDEIITEIAAIGAKKGIPVSDVVETYLNRGISKEIEITSAERYHFMRRHVIDSLDAVFLLYGIKDLEGSLSDKCIILMTLCMQKTLQEKSQTRNGIIEVSFFEILNDIKSFDKAIFDKILVVMGKSGRIRERYFQLYPK